jgi:hypothetical protein
MWKTLVDWAAAFLGMARELQDHGTRLRRVEDRIRDIEEALKLLAQEQRHSREMQSAECEKVMLLLERELANRQLTSSKRRRKKK